MINVAGTAERRRPQKWCLYMPQTPAVGEGGCALSSCTLTRTEDYDAWVCHCVSELDPFGGRFQCEAESPKDSFIIMEDGEVVVAAPA